MKRLLVIDALNLMYRAFFALPYLSNSQGQPTNAIHGFTQMLLSLIDEFQPDAVAIAWDAPGPSFRHEQYPEYKATRPPMPDDLKSQIPLVREIASAFNIPIVEREGFEADDIMGTLAEMARRENVETILATGDRDAFQLVDDHVLICTQDRSLRKNIVLDRRGVEERLGVPPEKVVDFKALVGDPSDNIPGVPGVGPKRAAELLQKFGDAEKVLAAAGEIPQKKLREALLASADKVRLGRELSRIVRNVPLGLSLGDLARKPPDEKRLLELFNTLELKTLLKRVLGERPPAPSDVKWRKIESEAEAHRAASAARRKGRCALYLARARNKLLGIALAAGAEGAWYLPLAEEDEPSLFEAETPVELPQPLVELLCDEAVEKACHDLKQTASDLLALGVELRGGAFDTLLAAYLASAGEGGLSLPRLAQKYLGVTLSESPSAEGACAAARVVQRLQEPLLSELKNLNMADLYWDIELPLADVLLRMERHGVCIDCDELRALGERFEAEAQRLEKKIYELAGQEFTINSPKQLQEILFQKLGLPPGRRTKTGYSTDAEELERLAEQHEIARHIIDYRTFTKLKSTYVDALLELVNPRTGRVHTRFNQAATATGRLSSSDPNLQNIPIRTEWGLAVRRCFVAPPGGYVLLTCDYSQIELRILAHFSRDENLVSAFAEGLDIHTQTAAQVFRVNPDEVTPAMRSRAKAVNFGIIYGMGPTALAKDIGITTAEAREFMDRYFNTYSGVREYIDKTIASARREGYVTTILGRRRYIPELKSRRMETVRLGERLAVNTPIQGSAADLIKKAMLDVDRELRENWPDVHMILQVHDELLFEVPEKKVRKVARRIRELMAGALQLSVPIVVDAKAGPNWSDMEPVA